jgi:N-methylhydantoinase A/oxoprolinase/acetone carboxylase beta subunit
LSTTADRPTAEQGAFAGARNTIDVDVGGTFTDMVMVVDGETIFRKVPTTPYDLSTCFMQVIEEGAEALGTSVEELAPRIDAVRYSTTVAMNRLIERDGPRLGLITTEGHEDALMIGKGAQWIDGKRMDERRGLPLQSKPEPLVPRDMIVGVKERIDGTGTVVRPLDADDVRRKVRTLVDRGARGFVVSLLWSFVNPEHEERVREIIREEYRDYHIGHLPVVLASQVVSRLGEYERTLTGVLDAYLQRSMRAELSATWDKLRDAGYTGPLFMVHNSGGCADVFKTTAGRTYNGGPVAGLIGAGDIARRMGARNVVASDVGGTSFDIGLVVDQSVRNYEFNPVVDTWMVALTMLQSLSIGAGGGSIASVNKALGGRLEVGPKSAGSYPGPAAYNLGGTEPTVTDADLVLGYLNPENYFGGRMRLDVDAATRAIDEKIAAPLGIDTIQAAALIRRIIDDKMASAIRKEVVLRGYRPSDFVLFAFGGGGPTHVAGYMDEIPRAVIFPFSPVFCAYGSSIMDVMHVYERSHRMVLLEPMSMKPTEDYETFNGVVAGLLDQAKRELAAEGFDPESATYALELDMLYGGQVHAKRTSTPQLFMNDEADVHGLYEHFEVEFSEAFSPLVVNKPGGVYIDTFVLKASVPGQQLEMEKVSLSGGIPAPAGARRAFWPETGDWAETPVFALDTLLTSAGRLEGPALIESEYTTVVLPPGKTFSVDDFGLGIIEST